MLFHDLATFQPMHDFNNQLPAVIAELEDAMYGPDGGDNAVPDETGFTARERRDQGIVLAGQEGLIPLLQAAQAIRRDLDRGIALMTA